MTGRWNELRTRATLRTLIGTTTVSGLAWFSHAWIPVFAAYLVGMCAAAGYHALKPDRVH